MNIFIYIYINTGQTVQKGPLCGWPRTPGRRRRPAKQIHPTDGGTDQRLCLGQRGWGWPAGHLQHRCKIFASQRRPKSSQIKRASHLVLGRRRNVRNTPKGENIIFTICIEIILGRGQACDVLWLHLPIWTCQVQKDLNVCFIVFVFVCVFAIIL